MWLRLQKPVHISDVNGLVIDYDTAPEESAVTAPSLQFIQLSHYMASHVLEEDHLMNLFPGHLPPSTFTPSVARV